MLRQILKNTIFLLLLSVTAAAQQPNIEYGQAGELRGIVKLFVFTDMDMQARAELIRELLKRLPRVEITETPEAADVYLIYRSETLHVPGALTWISESAPVSGASARHGYDGVRTTVVASQLAPVVVGTGVVLKTVGAGAHAPADEFQRRITRRFVRAQSAHELCARVREGIQTS